MVEGLPLGLLMQCYHMLSIFLSGGWGGCHFALCLLSSTLSSPLFFVSVLFSLFSQRCLGPVMAAAHLWAVRALWSKTKRSTLLKYLSLAPSLALILFQFLAISLGPSFNGLFSTCSDSFLPVIYFPFLCVCLSAVVTSPLPPFLSLFALLWTLNPPPLTSER